MPAPPPTRALYDRLIAGLSAGPARDVAYLATPGPRLDADTFERRVIGAERRLLHAGSAATSPAGRAPDPEAGHLALLSARNGASWLVALAALWKRGFVPLLADADLSRAEIAELATIFQPGLYVLDRRADPDGGARVDLGDALLGLHGWLPSRVPAAPRLPAGTVVVRLTSGSTGRPRAIALTADQILADARQIGSTMGVQPGDTMAAAIPLGHAYGFVHVFMSLVLQGTRPLLIEQPLPALLVEALSGKGPLVFPGTPYLFDLLLQAAPKQRRFKGLRLCISAGAPLPERLARAFRERFGLPIRNFYGASECGGIAYDRSRDGLLPEGCVGTPLDGVELNIIPEAGHEDRLGRVQVGGAAVAAGYLPAEPGDPLRAGRFLASDLGRLDDDGRLHVAGRVDRMINVGGRKVNPAEVEAILAAIPGVRQAVVFGAPDRHRGQCVCACIVGARRLTRETVAAALAARLAPFKVPRRIEFLSSLPVTGRGKTDRRALAQMVGG